MSVDRHCARDLALPRYREELVAAITRDVTTDPRVRAAFVGGSLGAGDVDLYSDIDLRIVVDAEDVDDLVANKTVRPQRWGSVLFYEDLGPRVAHTIAHFEGFIKVDCFYYRVPEVTPSLALQNIRILHDPEGLGATCSVGPSRSSTIRRRPRWNAGAIKCWPTDMRSTGGVGAGNYPMHAR